MSENKENIEKTTEEKSKISENQEETKNTQEIKKSMNPRLRVLIIFCVAVFCTFLIAAIAHNMSKNKNTETPLSETVSKAYFTLEIDSGETVKVLNSDSEYETVKEYMDEFSKMGSLKYSSQIETTAVIITEIDGVRSDSIQKNTYWVLDKNGVPAQNDVATEKVSKGDIFRLKLIELNMPDPNFKETKNKADEKIQHGKFQK